MALAAEILSRPHARRAKQALGHIDLEYATALAAPAVRSDCHPDNSITKHP